MKTELILKISIIFLLGFLSSALIGFFLVYGLEIPFSGNLSFIGNSSVKAPSDFIRENQIQIFDDKIIINVKGTSLSRYASTGSMIPTLDEHSNGIRIVPSSEKDINVGDIITFEDGKNLIVHRVIEKGSDKEGIYFITKGDSNVINDGKIRFNNIKYKTIGILW